jgi:hypothetical protein
LLIDFLEEVGVSTEGEDDVDERVAVVPAAVVGAVVAAA